MGRGFSLRPQGSVRAGREAASTGSGCPPGANKGEQEAFLWSGVARRAQRLGWCP